MNERLTDQANTPVVDEDANDDRTLPFVNFFMNHKWVPFCALIRGVQRSKIMT